MNHLELIKRTIQKEAVLHKTLSEVGLTFKEVSPLDVSYFEECSALMGLPSEKELKAHGISSDDFINGYVSAVYEDRKVDEVLKELSEKLLKVKVKTYDPKKNKTLIKNFIEKEQKLVKALKRLGIVDNGPLAILISDWDLATALLGKTGEDMGQRLFEVIDQGKKVDELFK